MDRFVQGHLLTAYPPSNPNRDDLGRPKTAIVGGQPRMRISSQAIKRAVRQAEIFKTALAGHMGERTQKIGDIVRDDLLSVGAAPEKAIEIAKAVAAAFGKVKSAADSTETEQLAFVSPQEKAKAIELARSVLDGAKMPTDKDLSKMVLLRADTAADIGMFGRMLAATPAYNRDAAVQVAHAFTTNRVDVEDDYYTSVDDIPDEDGSGAAFVGEAGFGSGVFYLYFCIDRVKLVENLGGDAELAERAIAAFVEAIATVSPSGKRNSFANHVRAEYVMLEKGAGQPINLFSAFVRPVYGDNHVEDSIDLLQKKRTDFAGAYGKDAPSSLALRLGSNEVTLADLCRFAAEGTSSLGTEPVPA